MHYVCAGAGDEGEPSLVLVAGFGGDVLDWTPVMPALARSHRVCAFDRLGQGWSDGATAPGRTFGTTADELHEAVRAAGLRRPIVVGHSLGGALAQVYAAEHDVAGLVLVDGLTAGVADAVLARLGTYQALAPLGQVGLLRPIAGMMVDPAYAPGLREQMLALRARSSALGAVASQGAVAAASAGRELRAVAPRSGRAGCRSWRSAPGRPTSRSSPPAPSPTPSGRSPSAPRAPSSRSCPTHGTTSWRSSRRRSRG